MVTLPQHCQKCVFQYTENDAMSYFHHRDICLGVGCGHAIIPKNTQSVCMFILSCVILHYDEFLTLFCILFVSGYHVGFIFCLQHLSGHLFYQHVSSITFFPSFSFHLSFYLATRLTCSLLPVFVFLSLCLLVLWTVRFLQLLPTHLSTGFEQLFKSEIQNLLKLSDDMF